MNDCCAAGNCGTDTCGCSSKNQKPKVLTPCPGAAYEICGLHKKLPQAEREERCNIGVTNCYIRYVRELAGGQS